MRRQDAEYIEEDRAESEREKTSIHALPSVSRVAPAPSSLLPLFGQPGNFAVQRVRYVRAPSGHASQSARLSHAAPTSPGDPSPRPCCARRQRPGVVPIRLRNTWLK